VAKRRSAKKKSSKATKASASRTRSKKSKASKKSKNQADLFDDLLEENIQSVPLRMAAQSRYLNYSLSVITSRALPDVRDGLKPVQRRILYTTRELGLAHTSKHRKSAKVVGDAMANYHPHGDSSIYDALVRMAQPFALREPLIDGSGNFGSIENVDAPKSLAKF